MKKTVCKLLVLILFAGTSCEEKIDIEKEKEAIIAAIENETNSHLARDIDQHSKSFLQDESLVMQFAGKEDYEAYNGWENISSLYKEYYEDSPSPSTDKYQFTNYNIKVYKESAWAVYDETSHNSEGEFLGKNTSVRILEKVDGEWKIVYLSFVISTSYDNVEKNKQTSATYHNLDPGDINDILTDDFIGHNEQSRFTWTKENHQNFWSNKARIATDSIFHQIADGNWVATRFQRNMNWQGKDVEFESMHFKRFENGKIAEIWEYADTKQAD